MIKNYYYFVTGILAILFAYTHSLNGQVSVLPLLNIPSVNTATQSTFIYVWHIITAENIIFGLALLIMSVQKDMSSVKFTAYLIAILMLARLTVIIAGTVLHNPSELNLTLTDSIAIIFYVALILIGTRVKDRKPLIKVINDER
jgi:hypothetical protein